MVVVVVVVVVVAAAAAAVVGAAAPGLSVVQWRGGGMSAISRRGAGVGHPPQAAAADATLQRTIPKPSRPLEVILEPPTERQPRNTAAGAGACMARAPWILCLDIADLHCRRHSHRKGQDKVKRLFKLFWG